MILCFMFYISVTVVILDNNLIKTCGWQLFLLFLKILEVLTEAILSHKKWK